MCDVLLLLDDICIVHCTCMNKYTVHSISISCQFNPAETSPYRTWLRLRLLALKCPCKCTSWSTLKVEFFLEVLLEMPPWSLSSLKSLSWSPSLSPALLKSLLSSSSFLSSILSSPLTSLSMPPIPLKRECKMSHTKKGVIYLTSKPLIGLLSEPKMKQALRKFLAAAKTMTF